MPFLLLGPGGLRSGGLWGFPAGTDSSSCHWPVLESARCTVRLASCSVCVAENGWQRPFCGVYAPSDEYEIVVQDIVSGLAKRAGVETTRLEHDVEVIGRATLLEPRLRSSLGGVQQPTASPIRRHAASLIGRDAERGVLDRLLDDVRGGASRALVVHGEAGMGKTALLEYVAGRASDCRVVSVAGAQAEMRVRVRCLAPVVRTAAGPPRRGPIAPT